MKSFLHIVRRTHLYLALFCIPWFVMYGITSFAFSHPGWFETANDAYNTSGDAWKEEGAWPCSVVVPEEGEIPREVAAELVRVSGLDVKAFGAYRSGERQVDVYFPAFWQTRRLSYKLDEQRLFLYSRERVMQNMLTSMHGRAGYQHDSFFDDAWAVMVDLASIGFLLWVVTGLVMWWLLPGMRWWGTAGLVAGLLAFAGFMLML